MNPDTPEVQALIKAFQNDGCGVYPTETLYAVGCCGYSKIACAKVAEIKNRPEYKPLPLIIGAYEQLSLVTDRVTSELMELAEKFWPGPLSILVHAQPRLAPQVSDTRGMTSVRFTAHETAAMLCRECDFPLVATSANRSGNDPAGLPEELDPQLLEDAGNALLLPPFPRGGDPSTVVSLTKHGLCVHRVGAIPLEELEAAGYSLTFAS